jgi:hypothetical protein
MEFLEGEKDKLAIRVGVDITLPHTISTEEVPITCNIFCKLNLKSRIFHFIEYDTNFLEKYFQYLRNTRLISHNSGVKLKTILMPALKTG